MKLILRFWQRNWQSVAFDTERGTGRLRWFRRVPSACSGWAFKFRGSWLAVWSNGIDLVLQVGRKQIAMTNAYHCSNVLLGRVRKFTIADSNGILFETTYPALDWSDDPTFDDVDLELNDFFLWTAELWNSARKSEVIRNWSALN